MKNLLKFGFLGLALTFVVAACNEPVAQEEAQEVEIVNDDVIVSEVDTLDTLAVDTVVVEEPVN